MENIDKYGIYNILTIYRINKYIYRYMSLFLRLLDGHFHKVCEHHTNQSNALFIRKQSKQIREVTSHQTCHLCLWLSIVLNQPVWH